MIKSIFVTHKNTLGKHLKITGGVQLCSQEFFKLLNLCDFEAEPYYVEYTKNIYSRFLIKYKFDCYNSFNVNKDYKDLINFIDKNEIKYVFINHASAVRYAKPIKAYYGEKIKIYLLSHGNDSGDFMHLTTKPIKKYNLFTKYRDLLRLGRLLHTESYFRINFLEGVLTVSSVEEQLEKWMGAKTVIYTPRTINKDYKLDLVTNYSKVGFIGRLDHPPNRQGFELLCDAITNHNNNNIFELSLIGAPIEMGKYFEKKYSFISYKGELLDKELEQEISTWALFLNPVFWYSMGVTTKIAKAIEWGIPVITTLFGLRGYEWAHGVMVIVKDENDMTQKTMAFLNQVSIIENMKHEMEEIKSSSYTIEELAIRIKPNLL